MELQNFTAKPKHEAIVFGRRLSGYRRGDCDVRGRSRRTLSATVAAGAAFGRKIARHDRVGHGPRHPTLGVGSGDNRRLRLFFFGNPTVRTPSSRGAGDSIR